MNLSDLVGGLWAITPAQLLEIQTIYATHLRGEKIDLAGVEARLGRPLAKPDQRYELHDGGVAVLTLAGIMAPKANLFMQVSGGMSTQMATKQLESAAVDDQVRGIIVSADTPGGSVLGVPEFATAIYELSKVKPIVFHSDGQLASAGYWSGAAANAIFISGPVVQVGSIGVVVTRNYDPAARVLEEHVTAGRYKRIAKANEPLSADSRAIVQADVDYVYSLFVDNVARFRGVSSDAVLEHMADGRVFRGQQAIDAGLVDGVSTLDALIADMAADPSQFATRRKARVAATARPSPKSTGAGAALNDKTSQPQGTKQMENDTQMTREAFAQAHPQLFASLQTEFMAAGAKRELDRQAAVRACAVPGHEQLVETLANDGKTSAADAALQINAAVRLAHKTAADAHLEDAPNAAAGSKAPAADVTLDRAGQWAKVQSHMATHPGCDIPTAMAALGYQH